MNMLPGSANPRLNDYQGYDCRYADPGTTTMVKEDNGAKYPRNRDERWEQVEKKDDMGELPAAFQATAARAAQSWPHWLPHGDCGWGCARVGVELSSQRGWVQ
eukprot:764079-Hanusia_phi.AAC.4